MQFKDPESSTTKKLRLKIEEKLDRQALDKLGRQFVEEFGSEVQLCDSDCSHCASKKIIGSNGDSSPISKDESSASRENALEGNNEQNISSDSLKTDKHLHGNHENILDDLRNESQELKESESSAAEDERRKKNKAEQPK